MNEVFGAPDIPNIRWKAMSGTPTHSKPSVEDHFDDLQYAVPNRNCFKTVGNTSSEFLKGSLHMGVAISDTSHGGGAGPVPSDPLPMVPKE